MQETEPLVHFKVLILFCFVFYSSLFSQSFPDKEVDVYLRTGIEKIITQDYNSANKIFSKLDSLKNDIPFGKIYLAAVEIARAYDYQQPFNDKYIHDNLEAAENLSKELLKKNPDNIWNKYFLALSKGYRSYYDAVCGNWLEALPEAVNSISLFEEILESDSSFHDAYIAIGAFKYWKSAKTEFLNWLPFVEDERDEGINNLRIAIKNSSYNYHLAINSLIWIYIDKEKYAAAASLAKSALEKYPQSRIFKWGLARAYENLDIEKAIVEYKGVLQSYLEIAPKSKVNIITLKHILAQQYSKAGKVKEAIKLCDEILAENNLSEFEKEKLNSRLKRVKKLRDELSGD